MEIHSESVDHVTVTVLIAEYLDASNAEEFKREVAPVLETNAKQVFDMSHLQFVDSAGLGALLSCLRRVSGAGGDLKLYGLTPPVRSVFEIARMHRIFEIFDTREAAVDAFRPRAG